MDKGAGDYLREFAKMSVFEQAANREEIVAHFRDLINDPLITMEYFAEVVDNIVLWPEMLWLILKSPSREFNEIQKVQKTGVKKK